MVFFRSKMVFLGNAWVVGVVWWPHTGLEPVSLSAAQHSQNEEGICRLERVTDHMCQNSLK